MTYLKKIKKKKKTLGGWSNSKGGRAFVLHSVNPDSIPGTPYGHLNTVLSTKPTMLGGPTPKKKIKTN